MRSADLGSSARRMTLEAAMRQVGVTPSFFRKQMMLWINKFLNQIVGIKK